MFDIRIRRTEYPLTIGKYVKFLKGIKLMITLDKLKFSVPKEALDNFNSEYFERIIIETEENTSMRLLKRFDHPSIGLNYIAIKKDSVDIEISSKILKSRYKEFINKDNFEYIIDLINSTGIIELNPAITLQEAEALRIDVTKDLITIEIPILCVKDIELLGLARGFRIKSFRYSGIEIYAISRSNNRRLLLYDKRKELKSNRTETNEELLVYCHTNSFTLS